jgi:trans-2,3-dihydro-3-hydroxyanthranilate isomerase
MLEGEHLMREVDYLIYDVFTNKALSGNPLAVVLNAEGLSDAMMQAIAREFNLSETIFFTPAQSAHHSAQVRIFMPIGELPFAGHPTIGGSIAFAASRGLGENANVVLEEGVGPVRCTVSADERGGHSLFEVPRLSQQQGFDEPIAKVAAALGLDIEDIGFGGHVVSVWSAGVPFVMVPVKEVSVLGWLSLKAEEWLKLDVRREGKIAAAYIYAPVQNVSGATFRARMFALGMEWLRTLQQARQ